MSTLDYYQLLGVSRYASQDALRRAYHTRVLAVHPDRNAGSTLASDRTRDVIEAYGVLSNPWSRQRYDLSLAVPAEPAPSSSPLGRHRTAPEWLMRALTFLAVIAVMTYVVMTAIQVLLAESGPVFRPNVALLRQQQQPVRPLPAIPQPDLTDAAVWYSASQYHLGMANEWATRKIVQTYTQAAAAASARGDTVRVLFYRRTIAQVAASRRQDSFL